MKIGVCGDPKILRIFTRSCILNSFRIGLTCICPTAVFQQQHRVQRNGGNDANNIVTMCYICVIFDIKLADF